MSEQRTAEWHQQRLGKVTASAIAKVMAKLKDGRPGADRTNYMAQLVCERLIGAPTEGFTNVAMLRGIEVEPQARAMYSFHTGNEVEEVGFVDHPTIEMSGASPDGLIGASGLVEIKCPNSATHIATLLGDPIERKYLLQMQWQMACCEREWCDFASFDDRLPDEMALHIQRVERDDKLIAEMQGEVEAFLVELDATVAELTARYMMSEAA